MKLDREITELGVLVIWYSVFGTSYFLPSTAARHFPYNSSRWVAYSSGFDAEPVP